MSRIVHTVFKMDKFKRLTKYKVFNDNGKEEKCRRGEFSLVYNEYKKCLTPLKTIWVIQERHKKDVIFAVPCYIPVNHESRPDDVVAIDLGVRTLMTRYDTNGFCPGRGKGDMKRVFSLCLLLDKLISRAYGPEMKNKHGKKGRRKRKSIRKAIERLPSQIKNKSEVDEKFSSWLCSISKVILIPKFTTKAMSARKGRKIHATIVRGMLCLSHYKFRQCLIAKSELFTDCKVIECDESYTCKNCGY